MTVAALVPSIIYLEDGVTLSFAMPWRFLAAAHHVVKRIGTSGAVTVLSYGVDWSASGGATDAGGTLLLSSTVAGARLSIKRVTPRGQSSDYDTNDTFPAESHEAALDRAMLVDQEQDVSISDVLDRAVMASEGQPGLELDATGLSEGDILEYRGGKLQAFDSSALAGKYWAGASITGHPVPVGGTGGGDATLRSDLALLTGAALIATPLGVNLYDWLSSWTGPDSITVGAGKDFTTLMLALDWLEKQPLAQPMYVYLKEMNTPDAAGGSMSIPIGGRIFNNPNSRMLYFEGDAFGGGQGVISNGSWTGTYATDLAYAKSRYAASIRYEGTGGTGGGIGLAFPHGIGSMSRILHEGQGCRYMLDLGYNGSHANASGHSGGIFNDCCFLNSVWGILGYGAHIGLRGTNSFAYQISGGPIGMFGGSIDSDVSVVNVFTPSLAAYVDSPQSAFFFSGTLLLMNPNNFTGKINIKGQFLHGIYAVSGASGFFMSASFNGVTQPITLGDATIKFGTPDLSNADPTRTSLTPGATQIGIPGNEAGGNLISVGPGGSIALNGGTIVNCVAARYVYNQGGSIKGYSPLQISASKATVRAFCTASSKGNAMAAVITTPQVGSIDDSQCIEGGDVHWFTSSGFSKTPVNNTPTNGCGNYS